MYLEFIKDLVTIGSNICIICNDEKIEGTIKKISSDLIALKNANGIVIIKDEDISNVIIPEDSNSESSSKENSIKADNEEIVPNVQTSTSELTISEDMSICTHTAQESGKTPELTVQEENLAPSVDSKVVEKPITEEIIETSFSTEETASVIVAPQRKVSEPEIYHTEIEKPKIKIVGHIDLASINDPRKRKKSGISEVKNSDNSDPGSIKVFSTPKAPIFDEIEFEKQINELLRKGDTRGSISLIDEALKHNCSLENKRSWLLKKAQGYSAISEYEKAKEAYSELISFELKCNSASSILSQLYTELARLQNLTKEDKEAILKSLNKAISYNHNNSYAKTLKEQILGNTDKTQSQSSEDEQFIQETEEVSESISKMIEIDIVEHKYSNELILNNGGVSTPAIAKDIYEEAKRTKDLDVSERFPVYLEAAKAYSELPVGSYDTQEYLESIAYYAILKGNSLFVRFKKLMDDKNDDISLLTHIKDSACSYYIESLNLLSNIESEHLLLILGNYLKMNIALKNIQDGKEPNISGNFNDVFFDCINSKDSGLNIIAWSTIVAVGTASPKQWNKLTRISGGTGGLYLIMKSPDKRQSIYTVLNRINGDKVDVNLLPGEFLKKSFVIRNSRNKKMQAIQANILKADFNIHMLGPISEKWKEIMDYIDLFSETEKESKEICNKVLSNLEPYAIRQSQIERTNLLIQAQTDLDSQIKFINDNTTYYGRIFFYPLFCKWRCVIQDILTEKISQTLPVLKVVPDPPFLVKDNGTYHVNLMIENVGESTASGYEMRVYAKSIDTGKDLNGKRTSYDEEISVGSHITSDMNLPEAFNSCTSIEFSIKISAYYQSKFREPITYRFTVEIEPENSLTREEIMWNDSQKMRGTLFKGRQDILNKLVHHYTSIERDKPYILYGLTRTGKSSILLNLKNQLAGKTILKNGIEYVIIPFEWDLSICANYNNARDLWQDLLYDNLYCKLEQFLGSSYQTEFYLSETPRAKDLKSLLEYLESKNIYPFFLVDEFSYIKLLMDRNIVNSAFLHTLRQFSYEGLASFIYAGTYDIKDLIRNPKYGITGQLVNAVEEQISEIDEDSAEELMNVMGDKLKFTKEAVKEIHVLSGDVPYFIQIICKYCGYYAAEKKRSWIGQPELERVVRILTGEKEGEKDSFVAVLPNNRFSNNLYNPQDRKEVNVLISSICYLNGLKEDPTFVSIPKLHELWASNGIDGYRPKISESLSLLLDRKVLIRSTDEGMPVYRISVDLFRRWWFVHHQDFKLEITSLQ